MSQILCDQRGADILAIHGQAPACPPVIALRGPVGAGRAGAGDNLQIDFVAAADDLTQPGGGTCSHCPLVVTLRVLAFLGRVKSYEPYGLAVPVNRTSVQDINILGGDRLGMHCRDGEANAPKGQQNQKAIKGRQSIKGWRTAYQRGTPGWPRRAVLQCRCAAVIGISAARPELPHVSVLVWLAEFEQPVSAAPQ
jgi:hypothetical protein